MQTQNHVCLFGVSLNTLWGQRMAGWELESKHKVLGSLGVTHPTQYYTHESIFSIRVPSFQISSQCVCQIDMRLASIQGK